MHGTVSCSYHGMSVSGRYAGGRRHPFADFSTFGVRVRISRHRSRQAWRRRAGANWRRTISLAKFTRSEGGASSPAPPPPRGSTHWIAEHGGENAALGGAKRSWAEDYCDIKVKLIDSNGCRLAVGQDAHAAFNSEGSTLR
jgi:hypothetical protein